jgi:hypothetical protein
MKQEMRTTTSSTGPRQPRHKAVYAYLAEKVKSGQCQPGDRLETDAELAEKFKISRQTVLRAIQQLQAEKLLVRHQGRGTFATGKNAEGGGVQGGSLTGNPRDWPAVHSQFSGAAGPDGLQLVSQANANWTFLWTRRAGDRQAYKVVPQFTVLKECQGQLVLEAGFDPAYAHTQSPWPGGFWVSKDASWCVPAIDTLPAAPGTATLNAAGQAIVVPADMQRFYLRLRLATPRRPRRRPHPGGNRNLPGGGRGKGRGRQTRHRPQCRPTGSRPHRDERCRRDHPGRLE